MDIQEFNNFYLVTGSDIEAVTVLAKDIQESIDFMRSPRIEYVRQLDNGQYRAKIKFYGLD